MATHAAFMPGTKADLASSVWSWITTVDHKRVGVLYSIARFMLEYHHRPSGFELTASTKSQQG